MAPSIARSIPSGLEALAFWCVAGACGAELGAGIGLQRRLLDRPVPANSGRMKKPLTLANQGLSFGAGEMNRTPDLLITKAFRKAVLSGAGWFVPVVFNL
jgi:hypothetical protein